MSSCVSQFPGGALRTGSQTHDPYRPLTRFERWSLGFALIVASIAIEISLRLPTPGPRQRRLRNGA